MTAALVAVAVLLLTTIIILQIVGLRRAQGAGRDFAASAVGVQGRLTESLIASTREDAVRLREELSMSARDQRVELVAQIGLFARSNDDRLDRVRSEVATAAIGDDSTIWLMTTTN